MLQLPMYYAESAMCEMFVKYSICKAVPIIWGWCFSVPWAELAHAGLVCTPCVHVVRRIFVRELPTMGAVCMSCLVEWCALEAVKGGYLCSVVVMHNMT